LSGSRCDLRQYLVQLIVTKGMARLTCAGEKPAPDRLRTTFDAERQARLVVSLGATGLHLARQAA